MSRDVSVLGRYWVFTLNNPTRALELSQFIGGTFLCYQKEAGANGTPHFQGMVCFTSKKSLRTMKNYVPGAHLEPMRGTFDQAYAYCRKLESRIEGPWEFGEKPKGKGKRTDLDRCKEEIDAGASEKEIADSHFGTWCRAFRALNRYAVLTRGQRHFQTNVLVYWGPPGSGKSSHAHELAGDDAYWLPRPAANSALWFDGYDGQKQVVIDEFYGWISRDMLCRLVDRYPLHVQTKGGSAIFMAERIYITSNHPPDWWYKRVGLGPLVRRLAEPIGYVYYVGNEEYPTEADYRAYLGNGGGAGGVEAEAREGGAGAFAQGFIRGGN